MPDDVSDAPIDTVTRIETPEHIEFQFRLAGPWRRVWAYGIDFIVRAAVLVVLALSVALTIPAARELGDLAGAQAALAFIAYFVLEWFYYVLFESLWNGRTPGKAATGLRVIKVGGYPIAFQDALLRNLLRGADLLPPLSPLPFPTYLTGVACSSADARFRRLGDLVAGTMVIVDEAAHLRTPAPIEPPPTPEEMATVPSTPRLAVEERRTLDAFIRRFRTIHPARREEICLEFAQVLAKRLDAPAPASGARYLQLVYARLSQTATPRRRPA
jgi:uncharacterized RDD family membrane protein YckC